MTTITVDRLALPVLEETRCSPDVGSLPRVQPGTAVPSVIVFDQDVKPVDIAALAADGSFLLSFYLYDWTGT